MAPRVERKLAAILAADVVGYSRLMGADEAGTHARLRAHRKEFIELLIAEHRGRMVKLTGDGALVEFASAVDAVECAVAWQNGMVEREAAEPVDRRIQFRIGINIGDIILEEGDIYGDGVNIATRLEGLAEPGGICIARNVHDQIKAKLPLPFEPMGAHRVKNIAEPVETFRVARDGGSAAPARYCWLTGDALVHARARRTRGRRVRSRDLAFLAGRARAQGSARDRGPAVREPRRGRGDRTARRRHHRGHHHRPRPLP
jgi:adenylate cyclase